MASDEAFMRQALALASQAEQAGEVPVGAVLVHRGEVIATGHNQPISQHDPSAHAEISALRQAAQQMGNYRLDECELYVTLEPCPMCAGALMHARVKRVIFGAADPKTGAAGSVLDLFALRQLNHQTQVQGGVLAEESGRLLHQFFQRKRDMQRLLSQPVREDAVRTPDDRFANLPGYPWQPRYVNDLPALAGLRMHYLDEGPSQGGQPDKPVTWLCLHGNPTWSYLYRKMIPVFLEAGHRVVAPDLIGFGRSDKPKKESAHHFSWHRQVLLEFIDHLDLKNIILVVQDWGGLLGLTLPMAAPVRYQGLLLMNTLLATAEEPLSPGFLAWRDMCAHKPDFDVGRLLARAHSSLSPQEVAAYNAPFPDRGHRAALRAFPPRVPQQPEDEGVSISRQAKAFWQQAWQGNSLMVVGEQDPVLGGPVMRSLQSTIRGCTEVLHLAHTGHFVPEEGASVAQYALSHFCPDNRQASTHP